MTTSSAQEDDHTPSRWLSTSPVPPQASAAPCRHPDRTIRQALVAAEGCGKNYNNLLRRFMDEGGHAYACRFSAAALYGMREIDMMEGVRPINPKDVLDAAITAWKDHALVLNTWTM